MAEFSIRSDRTTAGDSSGASTGTAQITRCGVVAHLRFCRLLSRAFPDILPPPQLRRLRDRFPTRGRHSKTGDAFRRIADNGFVPAADSESGAGPIRTGPGDWNAEKHDTSEQLRAMPPLPRRAIEAVRKPPRRLPNRIPDRKIPGDAALSRRPRRRASQRSDRISTALATSMACCRLTPTATSVRTITSRP